MSKDQYYGVAYLIYIPLFLAAWAYFIIEQGLFWGLVFGWLPAAIVALAACWAWPVALAAAALGGLSLFPALASTLGGVVLALFATWIVYVIIANSVVLVKKLRRAL